MKAQKYASLLGLFLFQAAASHAAILGYVDFESYPIGTSFGAPALAAGSFAFSESGVRFRVLEFNLIGGGRSYGAARIDSSAAGQMLELNNVILSGDFSAFPVTQITMEYSDLVGEKNFRVNGATLHKVTDLASLPTTIAPGVELSFTRFSLPYPSLGARGKLTLTGSINSLEIGGQEFFLDNLLWKSP